MFFSAMPQKDQGAFGHGMSCSAQVIVLGQSVPELGNELFCSANDLWPSIDLRKIVQGVPAQEGQPPEQVGLRPYQPPGNVSLGLFISAEWPPAF